MGSNEALIDWSKLAKSPSFLDTSEKRRGTRVEGGDTITPWLYGWKPTTVEAAVVPQEIDDEALGKLGIGGSGVVSTPLIMTTLLLLLLPLLLAEKEGATGRREGETLIDAFEEDVTREESSSSLSSSPSSSSCWR